jgi:hypothetical protein
VKTSDVKTAFTDVDLVVMLPSVALTEGESTCDMRTSMIQLSREHGAAIDKYAKKTVKVCPFNSVDV